MCERLQWKKKDKLINRLVYSIYLMKTPFREQMSHNTNNSENRLLRQQTWSNSSMVAMEYYTMLNAHMLLHF